MKKHILNQVKKMPGTVVSIVVVLRLILHYSSPFIKTLQIRGNKSCDHPVYKEGPFSERKTWSSRLLFHVFYSHMRDDLSRSLAKVYELSRWEFANDGAERPRKDDFSIAHIFKFSCPLSTPVKKRQLRTFQIEYEQKAVSFHFASIFIFVWILFETFWRHLESF